MTEYRATAKGFHGDITAIVDVEDGKVVKVSQEGEVADTIGYAGVEVWLDLANAEKTVDIDAISGASVSARRHKKRTLRQLALTRLLGHLRSQSQPTGHF